VYINYIIGRLLDFIVCTNSTLHKKGVYPMFDTFALAFIRKNVVVAPQACQGLSTLKN
jgi:hypothetical protein